MAKLSLSAEEWLAVYKAVEATPDPLKTPELAEAQKGIHMVLEAVMDMRDQMKDARGLFDVVCGFCQKPILERKQDYFTEHEWGNRYHAECWLKRE